MMDENFSIKTENNSIEEDGKYIPNKLEKSPIKIEEIFVVVKDELDLEFSKVEPHFDTENESISEEIPSDSNFGNQRKCSLPWPLSIRSSEVEGPSMGVWTEAKLCRGLTFGPYKGRSLNKIKGKANVAMSIDGVDRSMSNWPCFIKCSQIFEEANMVIFHYKGQIYYKTLIEINRGTELMLWCSYEAGRVLGYHLGNHNEDSAEWAKGRATTAAEFQRVGKRRTIIGLHLSGKTVKEIAEEMGISRTTVRLWIRRNEESGDLRSKVRRGCPQKTDAAQNEAILAYSRDHPQRPATMIRSDLQLTIGERTLRRRLQRAGIDHRRPALKEGLTDQNIADRLQFAHQYSHHDAEFWRDVIFSDEKVFVSYAHGPLRCWKLNGTHYQEATKHLTRRNGRVSQAYWGWMCGYGVGELVEIDERLNGTKYVELLEEILLPSVRAWILPEPHVIKMVHNNSSLHRCEAVRQFFKAHPEIHPIPWPSRSKDLKVIEDLWAEMVKKWDSDQARTKEALHRHVVEIWESLRRRPEICSGLTSSMPRRLAEVIAAEGKYTHY